MYLQDCLRYLINQTLKEIEIICIDDNSSDGSVAILGSAVAQYPDKVKALSLRKNRGAGGARNVGLSIAKGEYIGFVDSDDTVDLTMFEKLYNKAKESDFDIVDCGYHNEQRNTDFAMVTNDMEGNINSKTRSVLLKKIGYAVTKIYKKELLSDLRFRENAIYEDLDFLALAYIKAKKIGTVREILYRYKYYENSSSNTAYFDEIYYNTKKLIQSYVSILSRFTLKKSEQDAIKFQIIRQYGRLLENFMIADRSSIGVEMKHSLEDLRRITRDSIKNFKNNLFIDEIGNSSIILMEMNTQDPNLLIELKSKFEKGEEKNFVYLERKLEMQVKNLGSLI